jgi:uncharacterized protein (TIGR02996 family)
MAISVGALETRGLIIDGRDPPHRFPLDRDVIQIGRTSDCDLQIVHNTVGRRHCRLRRTGAGFEIEDTGSPGGTFVNGEKIGGPKQLHVGDAVLVGGSALIYFEHRAPAEPSEPRDPLLTAICDHPDDDEPRAAYADWLADHGEPRGDFIRYQLELARLPATDPRRPMLESSARALLDVYERTWIRPLPAFVESWQFHRGFVSAVKLDPRVVLDGDDFGALRRAHPIQALGFVFCTDTPGLLDQLAVSPRLDGIRQLDLTQRRAGQSWHDGLAARFGRGPEDGVYGPHPSYFRPR